MGAADSVTDVQGTTISGSGPLGSAASCLIYADVRLHIPMTHTHGRLVFDFNGANDGATFVGQRAEFHNVVIARHHSTDGSRELLYPTEGTADDCRLVLNYVTFVRHTANALTPPAFSRLEEDLDRLGATIKCSLSPSLSRCRSLV